MPPVYYDGIWELSLIYTVTPTGMAAIEHRATIDLAFAETGSVGDPFSAWITPPRGLGTGQALDVLAADFLAEIRPLYSADTSFARWELNNIPEGTTDKTLYSIQEISATVGSGADEIPGRQLTLTFRSLQGNTARFQLMETNVDFTGHVAAPAPNADVLALKDYITDPTATFVARDNEYIWSLIKYNGTINKGLFKKRYG